MTDIIVHTYQGTRVSCGPRVPYYIEMSVVNGRKVSQKAEKRAKKKTVGAIVQASRTIQSAVKKKDTTCLLTNGQGKKKKKYISELKGP